MNMCCICKRDTESVNHLCIRCLFAWTSILSWFHRAWVFLEEVMDLFRSWRGAGVGKRRRKMWLLIPLCFVWIVWQDRNNHLGWHRESLLYT